MTPMDMYRSAFIENVIDPDAATVETTPRE
jgi:hypothetical protein